MWFRKCDAPRPGRTLQNAAFRVAAYWPARDCLEGSGFAPFPSRSAGLLTPQTCLESCGRQGPSPSHRAAQSPGSRSRPHRVRRAGRLSCRCVLDATTSQGCRPRKSPEGDPAALGRRSSWPCRPLGPQAPVRRAPAPSATWWCVTDRLSCATRVPPGRHSQACQGPCALLPTS